MPRVEGLRKAQNRQDNSRNHRRRKWCLLIDSAAWGHAAYKIAVGRVPPRGDPYIAYSCNQALAQRRAAAHSQQSQHPP